MASRPARSARLTYPPRGDAYTVGLTGAPGAGKSTLTDRLIAEAAPTGEPVGVLAIDPSSPFSGGAILGDRVRMQGHALDDGVFIRSMATRGHLGGLALAAPEAVRVLDAAGMPWSSSRRSAWARSRWRWRGRPTPPSWWSTPGWGDAIQANKAGLLEIADIFVINKADRPGSRGDRRDLDNMLDMGLRRWATGAPRSWPTVGRPGPGRGRAVGGHRRPPGATSSAAAELDERRRAAGSSSELDRSPGRAGSRTRCASSEGGEPTSGSADVVAR